MVADDADLLLLAPAAMLLEVGTADPAMQNADGVLVEAQGHGYHVLGLQHEIGGGVVPSAVGSLAGAGLAAQLAAVGSAMAVGWGHNTVTVTVGRGQSAGQLQLSPRQATACLYCVMS